MNWAVFTAGGLMFYVLLCLWATTRLRYHLTPRHFKITLFGLCLRRIHISDIDSISKRRPQGWAENWSNTLKPGHRTLVLRRKRGLRRFLIFTPLNRYIFKTDLEREVERTQQRRIHEAEDSEAVAESEDAKSRSMESLTGSQS